MTDAELIRLLIDRECVWAAPLLKLQQFHQSQLGRVVGPIHWMRGDTLGSHSWFGFYWQTERFWFGYGLQNGAWTPLIEADRSAGASRTWDALCREMPSIWSVSSYPGYFRLWGDSAAHDPMSWFLGRSRELHEFVVTA